MNRTTAVPLALYQANVELQSRLGELVQAGGQHWLEFGQRLVSDGIVESATEFQDIIRTQDWQRLAALPADAFWRQLQQRFGDQQAATQLAVAAQASFVHGLQEALQDWQHQTVAALDQAGLALPALDRSWQELFSGWQPVLPAASFIAPVPAPARAAGKKAAARPPAARKAPAAKKPAAAAKKPTAKKAATKNGAASKAAAGRTAKKPARQPVRKAAKKAATRR